MIVRPAGSPLPTASMTSRSGRAQFDLADVGCDDVTDHRAHDGPGRLGGAHGAEPLGAASEDVGHVGEGLDVVDERRVRVVSPGSDRHRGGFPAELGGAGEEALLVRREQARQGWLALDDLEHGLLLAEEVLVGSGDDVDGAVGADAGLLELLHGPGDPFELGRVGGLGADVDLGGVDGEGGDHQPFDELVRVGAHQRPVLEGPRLALGAVADEVAAARVLGGDAGPLGAGGEASATATSQTRGADQVDGRLTADPLGGLDAPAAGLGGEVVVEGLDGSWGQ